MDLNQKEVCLIIGELHLSSAMRLRQQEEQMRAVIENLRTQLQQKDVEVVELRKQLNAAVKLPEPGNA